MSKIELELITDPDTFLFFENSIRGGISTISRGAGSDLKVEGHGHYFRREAPENFFRVPPQFWLVPPLPGGTRQKCGAHNVLTVILDIVNEERKT